MVDTARTKAALKAFFADNYAGFTMQNVRDLLESVDMNPDEATVTITNAQLLAIRAVPITLVAAPAAGFAIVVESVDIAKIGATVYSETGDNLVVEYASGADIVEIETTGFLDGAASARSIRPAATLMTPVAASAVRLVNSGDGEFGGGDVGNSLKVLVRYHLMPTA